MKNYLGQDGTTRLFSRHQYPCMHSRLYTLPSRPSLSSGHGGARRHCTEVQELAKQRNTLRLGECCMLLQVCATGNSNSQ